jgi:hypothetical protein
LLSQQGTRIANATPLRQMPVFNSLGGGACTKGGDVNIHRGSPLCNADFKIQANPSVNFIQITGPSCKSRIRIFNVIGPLLYETDFINSTNIGVGYLPAGIYFIECLNGMQRMTKKFLKG